MLAQVDMDTFLQNLVLIIGALVALGTGFVLLLSTWIGLKVAFWYLQRRHTQRIYLQQTRRVDGERYPGFLEGQCRKCGQGHRRIYYPSGTDLQLCPPCYEQYWREAGPASPAG